MFNIKIECLQILKVKSDEGPHLDQPADKRSIQFLVYWNAFTIAPLSWHVSGEELDFSTFRVWRCPIIPIHARISISCM